MENIDFKLELWDYVAFFGYFLLLNVIGYWAGKKQSKDAEEYFLAGKTLPWYVVGSSYIAANISTEHFIGLIGAAVIYGISVATGEWSTVIAFSFLIWLFIPFLLTANVYTAPQFLEKRFSPRLRLIFAVVSILANIFAFMGPVIYGGSLILVELFGFDKILACFIIGISAGAWAIRGGLKSVAFMDVLTIAIMVFGGLCVTFLGLNYLGEGSIIDGFSEMIDVNLGNTEWAREWIDRHVVSILNGSQEGDYYNRMSVIQPINHYSNPWTHWVFSFFYIGLWYTVINQHMIQKVFAAKDMYHARMGMVFASFLKLLLPFIVVVPGLIFFAMKPDFLISDDWSTMNDQANKTYIIMIARLVPVFLSGILLAALFGAIQSTVSSVLNSTSTLFIMDIYKVFKKEEDGDQEVRLGKITGVVILFLSIGVAILLATVTKVNLFIFIQAFYTFIAPPFSAIFLLGIVWKRVNGRDALITVLVSFGVSIILKILEFSSLLEDYPDIAGLITPFANQGLITWIFAMTTCIISSLLTGNPDPEQISGDLMFSVNSKNLLQGLGRKWYNSVTFWWSVCFVLMIALIILFSIVLR